MAHWDTSALLKLYLCEPDSSRFETLADKSDPLSTAFIARYEARAAFYRRETEGSLPTGGAEELYQNFLQDIAEGQILEIQPSRLLDAEYRTVLQQSFSYHTPVFIRTNDAIHLAAARVAEQAEFITADARQRASAKNLNLAVSP